MIICKYLTSHREIKLLRRQRAFVFATGASQFAILEALTGIAGLPWNRIVGFHLDEYVEIPAGLHSVAICARG
jgi:6-phosphogluconolactonase/glucosamine-6-phosphate isomerase/deaminase